MITLNLTIDKRRSKKDGSYPLIFRVAANGATRDISTKYSCEENNWNSRAGHLKDSHPLFSVIAPRLKELEIVYLSKAVEYEKLYPNQYDIQRIKEYIITPVVVTKSSITVYDFWIKEIQFLNDSNRGGGAVVYELSLAAINKVKPLNITFEKIDYTFLRNLEAQFTINGLAVNSIGVHMRSLRAVFNKAVKSKIVSYENYPFEDYKIRKEATTPRPITIEQMSAFFNIELDKTSWLYDSWLLGKLMFMLIGINFKDMILLNKENVVQNRVQYTRAKTKALYTVNLLPDALDIIRYFDNRDEYTLFGKLTKSDLDDKLRLPHVIKQKNKNFNAHLEKLGTLIGCEEKLTSYVFRYSWANIAKSLGYSKDMIAEALGHQYGSKVTGIYLEAYDKELIDEMNHKVYLSVK